MKICPGCHLQARDDAKDCVQCGHQFQPFGGAPAAPQFLPPVQTQPRTYLVNSPNQSDGKRGTNPALWFGAAMLAAILGIWLWAAQPSQTMFDGTPSPVESVATTTTPTTESTTQPNAPTIPAEYDIADENRHKLGYWGTFDAFPTSEQIARWRRIPTQYRCFNCLGFGGPCKYCQGSGMRAP